MELRNPFGLQNGQIIMIEDIDKAHNGLRCNCVCPACKEPFVARMGNVNLHHFAHSGKGCDEINAYMTGLYMLLSEYLTSNKLYFPPVIVGFELSAYAFWTQENVVEHSWLMSESREPDREILLYQQSKMDFDKAEIVRNVFFVTLNKSDKEYSPTTMYNDYSINERLFHWQSQSTTAESSPTGQRYIHHRERGSKVLIFVREFKSDRITGGAEAYTYLGTANYVKHEGSRPMNITWSLDQPIPAKYLKKTNKLVVG